MSSIRQIICPHCAAANRLPTHKPALAARCGRCRNPLFGGKPIEVDAAAFERHTRHGGMPVLVDAWAPWCGPCRMMAPAFEAAASELEPEVRLIKLNTESEPQLAGLLGIRSIPTMLLFAGGREIARISGAMTAARIVGWTQGQLNSAGTKAH